MKKTLIAILFAVSGAVNAEPISMLVGGVVELAPFALGAFVGNDASKPVPACYSEPTRKVAWANNPKGYSFTVAGCDFQSKKDQLVEVK